MATSEPEIVKTEIVDKEGPANSVVWKHFGFMKTYYKDGLPKVDKSVVYCKVEGCKFQSKYASQTTNMKSHLDKHHAELLKHPKENSSAVPLKNFLASKSYLPATSTRAQAITEAVAEMLVFDLVPFSLVESQSFKKLVSILEPRYKVPARSTFTRSIIPKLYQDTKKEMKDKFQETGKNIYHAITHDCWTSLATESFSTVTGHFIDPQTWNLESCVFETKRSKNSTQPKI